jgi:NADH-quinone oxidoreductase subunit C
MHSIAEKIKGRFADDFVEAREYRGQLAVTVKKSRIVDICRFLHDDPELAFNHITDVTAADYPNDEERFEVVYHFYSIPKNQRIRLKARVREEDCTIDSVTGIWQGANFMEREAYDLMGIRFNGHPDLRRILLTDDFEGHPLRKDYPVEGRGWRNTFEFLPKSEEVEK